jgi:maleamate amidohydrolase
MTLNFIKKDERVLYVSEGIQTYKQIMGIDDINELPRLYKKAKRPSVLVIDEQYSFTSVDSLLGSKGQSKEVRQLLDGMVENTKILLDAARKKKIPIIYFYVGFRDDAIDCGRLGEKVPRLPEVCKEGSKWVQIDERVKPQKGDFVLVKKMYSGFFGTPLDMILKMLRVDVNIIVGNSTSGCVRGTALDSMQHGYYTVLPEACIADRSIGAHKANLFDMMMKYADVVPLDDVLSWINSL